MTLSKTKVNFTMKKIFTLLLLLIVGYVAFWYFDSSNFEKEVQNYLKSQQITFSKTSVRGFPLNYKVLVSGLKNENSTDKSFTVESLENFIFSKKIFSRKMAIQMDGKISFSYPEFKDHEHIPSHGTISGKLIFKDLPRLESLNELFTDLFNALTTSVTKQFSRKIIVDDFSYYIDEKEPLITWDKLFLSLRKTSAVGGVYRTEADIDLVNFKTSTKKFWDQLWSETTKKAAIDQDISLWLQESMDLFFDERKDLSLHFAFTLPDDFSLHEVTDDLPSLINKVVDAEAKIHFASLGATINIDTQVDSVIIDENTKQVGYDLHYAANYSDHYWQVIDAWIKKTAELKSENKEMEFPIVWAKTWTQFNPHWKNDTFDYGFLTDVDRKTSNIKSAALKQFKIQVDDMSIEIGTADEVIDLTHIGTVGDQKIPIAIHQYKRLFGGIAEFFVKFFKEAKAADSELKAPLQPKDNLPANLIEFVKALSDEPDQDSPNVTITVQLGESGPKKVGTLSVIKLIKQAQNFYEKSFDIEAPKAEVPKTKAQELAPLPPAPQPK